MDNKKVLENKIALEISNLNLPICLQYVEEPDKMEAYHYNFPIVYHSAIGGDIELDKRRYYKHISRTCIEPYKSYDNEK